MISIFDTNNTRLGPGPVASAAPDPMFSKNERPLRKKKYFVPKIGLKLFRRHSGSRPVSIKI